jgi:glycosyltransferase involved in cell wall biosynthesis
MTTPQPKPILFYHPDGYRVAREDLKGRHSAGEAFLSAFLDRASGDVFGLCADKQGAEAFSKTVAAHKRGLKPQAVTRGDVSVLRRQGLLNLPHPDIATEARLRNFLGDDSYAVCGVTHTISSHQILNCVADLAVAPVQPWDALICTSRAVHASLSSVLETTEEHLRARLGAAKFTRPLMPVIPLGVHARRFTRKDSDRVRWRQKLGLSPDTVAILFFGRLSVHAKASPFQLAQAAELAAARGKHKLAIIWCGWFSNDFQRKVFMETVPAMAPSVSFHHVDGRDEDARFSVWAAADIFSSLSDNIQESFGLTVIEAMAAGLPVVVSNWNGYREALEDGVNGLMVDSYLPQAQLAETAYRYISGVDNYDFYIGGLSQFCFVDVEQTATALSRLAGSEALRKQLAAAARATVERNFDWAVVMPRYEELWREQSQRLAQARGKQPASSAWKMLDPAYVFKGYASRRLDGASRLAPGPYFARWEEFAGQPGVVVHPQVLAGRADFQALRALFADGKPRSVDDLLAAVAEPNRPAVWRTLHWAIKVGLLALVMG